MTSTPISSSYLRIRFSCLWTELIYYRILWHTFGNIGKNPSMMASFRILIILSHSRVQCHQTASSFPVLKMRKTRNLLRAVKRVLLFCLHKAFKIKMIVCISYTSDSSIMYKIHFYVLSDDSFHAKEIKTWDFLVEKISRFFFSFWLTNEKLLFAYDCFQYSTVILPLLWHPCVLPLEVHEGKAWHWALLKEQLLEGPTYTYIGLWTDSKNSDRAEGNNTFTVNTA